MSRFNITAITILYLLLPIDIFFITWLHSYIGIPSAILLTYAAYHFSISLKQKELKNQSLHLSKNNIAVSAILFAFLLLSGHGMFIGGIGYDTPWRNATYYDLIYQSWPVIYEYSQSALIYYLTYWITPASICHLLGLNKVWANVVLFTWSFIGLRLFLSLLFNFLQAKNHQLLPILFIFLFWSGLNTIGMLIVSDLGIKPFFIDSEWGWHTWLFTGFENHGYAMSYMIRTTFDSLANIYHQFIPMLLCTILFLKYRSLKNIFFITFLLIPFSPLGAIGLCLLAGAELLKHLYKNIKAHKPSIPLKEILSIQNLLAAISIIPIFFLYFTANNALGNTNSMWSAPLSEYDPFRLTVLIFYYLLYFIIFLDLCKKDITDKTLFVSVLISLMILPLFKVGRATDFCWNASMPAFFIVMVFIMQKMLQLWQIPQQRFNFGVSLLILLIAFSTPCLQIASQFKKCYKAHATMVYVDFPNIGDTFSNKQRDWIEKNYSDLRNFQNPNYQKKSFYIYLAKEK